VVGAVTAIDRDTFPFNRIVYSLDPTSDQLFHIDPDTGRLVTRRPLDREEKAFHCALVERCFDSWVKRTIALRL